MRVLAAFVGILVLLGLYVVAAFAVLVFISTPLVLAGLAAGLVAGTVVGLQRSATVLGGRFTGTPIRTAADAVEGKLAGRVRKESLRRDYAWPQYFVVQVGLDIATVIRAGAQAVGRAWSWTVSPLEDPDRRRVILFFWPLLLPVLATLVALSTGAAAMVAVVALLAILATGVAWLVGAPAVGVLRVIDRSWQIVFRAQGSCPKCYRLTAMPAYRCPGPHTYAERSSGADLHRDIRPGRLGVLWRRCGCGQRLPTTVLRAAWQIESRCPACSHQMHRGSAVARDVRLPVFGAASAGKTHLIMAAMVAVIRTYPDRASIRDRHSLAVYAQSESLIDNGRAVAKTAASPPLAVTVRIRSRLHVSLVHFFDAAGESMVDPSLNAQLSYLDFARSLVYVLDPFSVEDVRDQASATFAKTLREANAATYDPEESYNSTVNRLHKYGVDTRQQWLVFVVSKADLLHRLPIAAGLSEESDSVREWLARVGLDNLVTAAQRDFGEVRFFAVSTTDPSVGSALAPVRWLLGHEGIEL
jgi:Double-GTPase 2